MTDQAPQPAAESPWSGLSRVLGSNSLALLPQLRFAVVGVGGVGSWVVEALARSAVGHLSIIDHDDITAGNINRQLPALHSTLGRSKVELMQQRVADINPHCECVAHDDFLAETNLEHYLEREFDAVIDAIDSIRFKAAMIHFCRRRKIRIITTGGAGGRRDPLAVGVADLSRTWNDALAAKVRSRLRAQYGYTSNPRRRFGVECVFSSEQPVYPDGLGDVGHARPGVPGARLDCDQGYGSMSMVTATFGMVAASRALNGALQRRQRDSRQLPPAE